MASKPHTFPRRVAGLPALSEEQYDTQAETRDSVYRQKDSDEQKKKRMPSPEAEVEPDFPLEDITTVKHKISEKIASTQCLFCNLDSPTLDANVDHMSSLHGLFIPSPDQLSDMESFLGYLAVIIFEYTKCLYCGSEKGTVDGVQTHMRDKGHCMIKMNTDPELLDFWELSDNGDEGQNEDEERIECAAIKLSDTEWRLPSGAIINARSDTTHFRSRPGIAQLRTKSSQYRTKRDELRAITAGESQETDEKQTKPASSNDRRVAVRGEMGLAGVSESQRRALQITAKKMKQREAIAKTANRHAMEQQPVRTMYYKVRVYDEKIWSNECSLMHEQTENPVYQAG
ncbi:hypothetical protein N0V83_003302 [Neocucurbitaria cava]|uniref:ZN622/Rei1/Reh1 zinc finger C2H2-type domain-containing protein n=1 Tax=Neocucurbitaria cava TaxID=798079 RepID=A0A9W8YCY6_9PLEO|nr:hypothetical protein N0V83_003302 [Neocucurbitaria cava]